jgi:aspartate carbamoyltransferase catalytic subunit
VADLPRAVITDQVTNGIAVRMSLLYLILGGDRRVIDEAPGLAAEVA